MATKDLNFRIKVDGKEVDLAKTSINDFNKIYTDAQKKLKSLPLGSEEWKKLNSDIKNADKAFSQTKDILSETETKFKSLKVQIRQATIAFQEAEEKGDIKSMKKLRKDLDDLNDQLEVTTLKSMKFSDALATMPGIAGFVGQSIQGVDKAFKVLVANPILAVVTAVVGAFMFLKEALGKTKEGQAALNKVTQAFSTVMGPLLALINTVAVPIFEKLADIIGAVGSAFAWFAEKLGVSKKSIAEATKDVDKVGQEAAENEKKRQEEAKQRAEKEAADRKQKAEDEKKRKQDTINDNESLKQSEVELERAKKQSSDNTIQSLKEKQAQADEDYNREKKRIEDLMKLEKVGSSEYKKLQTEKNNLEKDYLNNKKETNKQIKEEEKKNQEELEKNLKEYNQKVLDIRTSAIQNEFERSKQERKNKYEQDLKDLEQDKEFIKKSEEEKNELRKLLKTSYDNDVKKIDEDNKKKDQDDRIKKLDDDLKFLQIKGEATLQGTKAFYDNQRDILNKAEQRELADTKLTEAAKTAIKEKYVNLRKKLSEQEFAANALVVSQTLDAVSKLTAAIASSYDEEAKTSKEAFEKRKKLQIATALMSAASGVIQILTQPSTLPSPFDWIVKGINAAALAVTTGVQIANIKKTQFEGGATSASTNLGKNYEDGGMINGPRHAQGGVMIEAEGGEAVMTRGAVTMFKPLLSMMNQMGGGTSFSAGAVGGARPDAPLLDNPSVSQQPTIMKTYVVSNELTTEVERQARLKDLSTL